LVLVKKELHHIQSTQIVAHCVSGDRYGTGGAECQEVASNKTQTRLEDLKPQISSHQTPTFNNKKILQKKGKDIKTLKSKHHYQCE
jgi:hypothetical protein